MVTAVRAATTANSISGSAAAAIATELAASECGEDFENAVADELETCSAAPVDTASVQQRSRQAHRSSVTPSSVSGQARGLGHACSDTAQAPLGQG
jgi:hypothetical protein